MRMHLTFISLILLTTLTLPTTMFAQSAKVELKSGNKVGQAAPGFSLKKLGGGKVSLDELKKKGHVMLIFWEPNCVYCFSHIRDFNTLHDKYKGKLTLAGINFLGEYEEEVAEYVKDNGLKYLMLTDRLNNIDVAEAYRVIGSPTIVLIAPDGKIVFYGYDLPDITKWIN